MYYCAEHQVAFEKPQQWGGHRLHHPGETFPKAEEAFVEEVPEGTKVVPAPAHASNRTPKPETPSEDIVRVPVQRPPVTPIYVDEEEVHLDSLLDGIGIPPPQRQTIVKGWRHFPVLHQHPANLESYIASVVGPKFRASLPLVVHAMFPGTEQEETSPQYMYGRPGYGGRAPVFWQGYGGSPYPRQWEMEPPPYFYSPYARAAPSADTAEANPQVAALQKQVETMSTELLAERAERARESLEQKEKEREAAWQAQLNAVVNKVDSTFKEFGDLVKHLGEQIQAGKSEGERSHTEQLVEQVEALKDTLASDREARLQGTVDALRGELGEVRQKINTEPTGKTTEDLISQGIPLALAKLDNLGETVTGELRGIRQQAADGKLPSLTPPTPPGDRNPRGEADPVKTAQQIAGARALKNDILAMTNSQGRG